MTSPAAAAWAGRLRAVWEQVPRAGRRLVTWMRTDEFFTTSSSLAFYAMVSLPPMVLIALWAAGAVVSDETLQGLGQQVEGQAPQQLPVADVLRGLIDVATHAGVLSVVAAAWPATAYGAALARAFSRVAPEPPGSIRGWKGRLLALVIVAVLPLVVFAALAALYVVPRLVGSSQLAVTAVLAVAAFVALAAVVALVLGLFRVRDTRISDVVLAALLTAGLEAVVTAGYLVYLQFFADFTDRYGASSLATAVLLGLWLLLGNAVLLVGYRVMLRRAARRRDGGVARE